MRAVAKLSVWQPMGAHWYRVIVGGCLAVNRIGVAVGIITKPPGYTWSGWKFVHIGNSDTCRQFQIRILLAMVVIGEVEKPEAT